MFFDGVREGRALRNQLNNEWADQLATLSQIRRQPLRAKSNFPRAQRREIMRWLIRWSERATEARVAKTVAPE